jgi:hypothetical protein
VQKLSNEPSAHTPLVQSACVAHGSPTAPDVHFPPKFPTAQRSSPSQSSSAEHALPALPSLHVPSLEPA